EVVQHGLALRARQVDEPPAVTQQRVDVEHTQKEDDLALRLAWTLCECVLDDPLDVRPPRLVERGRCRQNCLGSGAEGSADRRQQTHSPRISSASATRRSAIAYAAVRSETSCSRATPVTSRYAATIFFSSAAFTCSSSHRNCCRFCVHSKYDTTTPPALVRKSGSTRMPRSARILSAIGVVGPFAASTSTRHASSFALSSFVMTPPSAAGIR